MIVELPDEMELVKYSSRASERLNVVEIGIAFRDDIAAWCAEHYSYPIRIEGRQFENPSAKLYRSVIYAVFKNDADAIHFKMRWL